MSLRDAEPVPGMRRARRVKIKFSPPGTSPERLLRIAESRAELRATMARAALDLVAQGRKPTIKAVTERVVAGGGKLSLPTANRHTEAIHAARVEWERRHGRQPEWHRRARGDPGLRELRTASSPGAAGEAAEVDGAAALPFAGNPGDATGVIKSQPGSADGIAECSSRLEKAQKRFERLKALFDKVVRSREKLHAENLELREQVRRLEFAFKPGD